jgi:nucleoside-diphosphate-sugar epimerase
MMREARQGFIPVFVRTALEGDVIKLFGGGGQIRDANYVADVVDAFLRAGRNATEQSGRIFNLGGSPSFSLREFTELLIKIVGRGSIEDVPWPPEKAKIDIGDFETDYSRITATLDWRPRTSLEHGLERMVDFYRQHGEHYW